MLLVERFVNQAACSAGWGIAIAVGVMGIPLLVRMIQSDRERAHRLSIERKEIVSSDRRIKVTVPGNWVKLPGLNKAAALQLVTKIKRRI